MRATMKRRALVFLKNEEDGSSYYRLYQYLRGKPCRRVNMTPTWVYRLFYGRRYGKAVKLALKLLMGGVTFGTTLGAMALDALIWKSEVVIVNRRFFPRACPPFLAGLLKRYLRGKKVYWDFDDNIALDGELSRGEKAVLEAEAAVITVTSEYLRESLGEAARAKVTLLPTTDLAFWGEETEELLAGKGRDSAVVRLLWLGTRDNLPYLEALIPALEEAAETIARDTGRRLELSVVSNAPLNGAVKHLTLRNIRWSRARGIEALREAEIGLMPLRESAYTLGKGGFKAIQYMSAGVVPILSPVGYNKTVIEDGVSGYFAAESGEFATRIAELAANPTKLRCMARAARARFATRFSPEEIQAFWNQAIGESE